jgi:demethylmenaquinone methyltransferase / 2-methoxy-6-polyprenyl-1,4-benzoquinol methylase
MESEVNGMFSRIAGSYDFMNHLFSMNIDKKWREEAANAAIIPKKRYTILDIAAGTGDLSIAISHLGKEKGKDQEIIASDFNKDMLEIAKNKINQQGITNISTLTEDALRLKHESASIDVVTSAFGLRSFASIEEGKGLEKFIGESYRVLKKGGKIVLLDMAAPTKPSQKTFFRFYSVIMKGLGSFVDRKAYSWLIDTINKFDKQKLVKVMKKQGFRNIRSSNLTSGIAYLITASK